MTCGEQLPWQGQLRRLVEGNVVKWGQLNKDPRTVGAGRRRVAAAINCISGLPREWDGVKKVRYESLDRDVVGTHEKPLVEEE